MDLTDLLRARKPDIPNFDAKVNAWAEFVASNPQANIRTYLRQQELLRHVSDNPIIGASKPEEVVWRIAHEQSESAKKLTRELKQNLIMRWAPRGRIVSVYQHPSNHGLEEFVTVVTGGGLLLGIDKYFISKPWEASRTYQLGIEHDGDSYNRLLTPIIGGNEGANTNKWVLWTHRLDNFTIRGSGYKDHTLKKFKNPDTEALLEKGEYAINVYGALRIDSEVNYFETNHGRLLHVELKNDGTPARWEDNTEWDNIQSHRSEIKTSWTIETDKGKFLICDDGEVYDTSDETLWFYRIDRGEE